MSHDANANMPCAKREDWAEGERGAKGGFLMLVCGGGMAELRVTQCVTGLLAWAPPAALLLPAVLVVMSPILDRRVNER